MFGRPTADAMINFHIRQAKFGGLTAIPSISLRARTNQSIWFNAPQSCLCRIAGNPVTLP
jgi:hypothetical protein